MILVVREGGSGDIGWWQRNKIVAFNGGYT